MASYGPLDPSCIHVDRRIDASDAATLLGHPDGVLSFGEMILLKLVRKSDEASDECLSLGMSQEESEHLLVRRLAVSLHSWTAATREDAIAQARAQVRTCAVDAWMESHHVN